MPVKKPIIEIPVDDEKFRKFYALYVKYKDSASKDSSAAEKIGKRLQQQLKSVLGVQEQIAASSRTMALSWSSISSSTKTAYGNITNAVSTLAKWTGIGGLITGGSVGILGLGFDRLAGAASAGRRSSSGLGMTYGQQRAFTLSYDRLLDSQSFLGGVSTARGNVASGAAGALFSLGINPTGPGGTAGTASAALAQIRSLVQNTPDEQLGMQLDARRLGELGLTTDDLRRIKGLSDEEFGQYQSDYAKRTGQVDVADQTLKKWQDFYVQLDTAGEKIKSALINGLGQLSKPLEQLSEALGDAVMSLMGSQGFRFVIGEVTRGLQTFADYVKTDEFKQNIKEFAEAIEMLARKTVAALRWLGIVNDPVADAAATTRRNERSSASGTSARQEERKKTNSGIWDWFTGLPWFPDKNRNPLGSSGGPLGDMDKWKSSIAKTESGGNYGALGPWVNGDRAHGKYQVMGSNIADWTQKALGKSLTPAEFLADSSAQEKVFEKVFGEYAKKYGAEGAARAWFAGEGGMNNRSARDVLGTSVQGYADKFNAGLGQPKVKIEINNNTGGSAIVNTSAMGIN